ncbi:MAG: ABC transporter ATP-binding protein [Nanopusillaceae archaeon]
MDIIKLENVTKIYKMGDYEIKALDRINLNIRKGELVSIMGPSGSGKSTLLSIIGCLDRPTSGKVYLFGEDVSKLSKKELAKIRAKKIGFVFQKFYLLNYLNAIENVRLALRITNRNLDRAKELLEKVGLGDRLYHYPNQLSGGQQQRVVIARALANNPDIILADEPTGNLDEKSSKEVMDLLIDLNKNEKKTIVIVTHNPKIAEQTDRIIVIRSGKILSDNADIEEALKLLK